MNDKRKIRKAYCILRRLSFVGWLSFVVSGIIGLISGVSWMAMLAVYSACVAFGLICASDLCVYRIGEIDKDTKEAERS